MALGSQFSSGIRCIERNRKIRTLTWYRVVSDFYFSINLVPQSGQLYCPKGGELNNIILPSVST